MQKLPDLIRKQPAHYPTLPSPSTPPSSATYDTLHRPQRTNRALRTHSQTQSSASPQDLLKTAPSPETDLRFKQIGGE